MNLNRRQFLWGSGIISTASLFTFPAKGNSQIVVNRVKEAKLKISCNLYSYNRILRNGEMSLEECIDFCAKLGFDAVDITGYYIKGHPGIPTDEYLYSIKKRCFLNGLDISGTGVRNDFTIPDKEKRAADVQHIKEWIQVAAKLGAPVIRIFAGHEMPEGYSKDQMRQWVVEGFKACAEFGRKFGIVVAVQNHAAFIKTAAEVKRLIQMVNHEWFGLVEDVGSFPTVDPYKEIEEVTPFAVNWQIKENLNTDKGSEKTDLIKLFTIIKKGGYRGYLPIETLGEGDPREKVPRFLNEVRQALKEISFEI